MSLTDPQGIQLSAENITEYTVIAAPLTLAADNGDIIQQAIVQQVATSEQENIDPQSQVLMIQPITVNAAGDQLDGQFIQHTQFQILHDQASLEQLQQIQAVLQEQGVLQLPHDGIHHAILQDGSQLACKLEGDSQPLQELQQQQIIQLSSAQLSAELQQQLQTMHEVEQQQLLQEKVAAAVLPPPVMAAPRAKDLVKPPVGKGPFTCEKCGLVFPKYGRYQRHLKGHEDDKPFQCPKCTQSFNVEDNLTLHQALHDTDNPHCPECGKKFSRVASLKAHLMLHEREENLVCDQCGDEFAVQSQLDRHAAEHREEEQGGKIYPCKQCNCYFPKPHLLRDHMKQHYKIKHSLSRKTYKRNIDRSGFHHKCKHCNKTFQKPSQLERHERIHTGDRPFKCDVCNKAFNQKGALQIHMKKHTGDRPFPCDFCPQTFTQRGNLRAHIHRVHNHSMDTPGPTFQCAECSCVFRKLGSLNAHMNRAHADTQDIVFQVDSQTSKMDPKSVKAAIQQLLELSEQTPGAAHGVVGGQQGSAEAVASDILQQALENSGLPAVTIEEGGLQQTEPGPADQAGLSVEAPQAATDETSEVDPQADAQSADGIPKLTAAMLGTDTISLMPVSRGLGELSAADHTVLSTIAVHDSATGVIKRHIIRKINGVRWHQCIYCSKEFKKPSDLIRHIRIHTHEKPFKCGQCFRSFAVKSTLTAHAKTHSGVKENKCATCEKLFSSAGSLKVHVRLHTGLKPFGCTMCDKQFRTSGHRKTHLESHYREQGVRKPRKIARRQMKPDIPLPDVTLQEPFLITDSGVVQQIPRRNMWTPYLGDSSVDRPFKCNHCSRGFKKSSHLKQHVRSHTGEKPYKCMQCNKSFVSTGVLKAHLRTHTGQKNYRCTMCESGFTTSGSLKRHMSTHSEVRPFMCPYCDKTFKTSVNCKKHMRTHKHDLALQALQQQSMDPGALVARDEVTIGPDVPDADEDDAEDLETMTPQEVQVEVTSTDLSQSLQVAQLAAVAAGQEHQTAALNLQQQELSQQTVTLTPAELSQVAAQINQQQAIQEALVSDVQFQSTLNQQVLGQGVLAQTTVGNQAAHNMGHSLLPAHSLGTQLLGHNQITLHSHAGATQLDLGSISSLAPSGGGDVVVTSLQSTSMQNILQTREPELGGEAVEDLQEEGAPLEADDGRRPYKCSYCSKAFKKSSHLKQHIRSHTGEKPYRCPKCDRYFVSSGVLRAHFKTHTGMKEFCCQMCGSSFTTNGSLTRHLMIHSTHKPYKCGFCSDTFRTSLNCKRHMKLHRDGGVEPSVAIGGPSRRTRSALIQITDEQADELSRTRPDDSMSVSEKVLIESAAEKDRVSELEPLLESDPHFPNQCQHCSKNFKKPSDLVRHMRIHTGEKPYRCDTCSRCFTVKSTLESHMRTHAAAEKMYSCHVCGSFFTTKGSLKVHMRLHTGAKPFRCPHCNQKFRTSGHRKSHIHSHFKPAQAKKRRMIHTGAGGLELLGDQLALGLAGEGAGGAAAGTGLGMVSGDQIISLDPAMLQGGMLPISLSLEGLADGALAQQVLQSLEGIQLQLTGTLTGGAGGGIQIGGLDPGLVNQTIQVDASVLQQLQQQGTISININPNMLTTPGAVQGMEASAVQNVQMHPTSVNLTDVVNPNVVIQSFSQVQGEDGQSMAQPLAQGITQGIAQGVVPLTAHEITLPQPAAGSVATQAEVADSLAGTVLTHHPPHLTVVQAPTAPADLVTMGEGGAVHKEVEGGAPGPGDENEDMTFTPEEVADDPHFEQYSSIKLGDGGAVSGDGAGGGEGQDGQEKEVALHLLYQTQSNRMNMSDPDRTHVCMVCGKAFKRSGHLKDHMLTHDPGPSPGRLRPTPYQCRECDKAFSKPSQLDRHRRIHTGERPYICEICNRAFNQKNALQVHLKRHSGAKEHQCPYCSMAFVQKGNLKTHIKRAHHNDMVLSMNLPAPAPRAGGAGAGTEGGGGMHSVLEEEGDLEDDEEDMEEEEEEDMEEEEDEEGMMGGQAGAGQPGQMQEVLVTDDVTAAATAAAAAADQSTTATPSEASLSWLKELTQ